jgi:signal transduction histidine kinase
MNAAGLLKKARFGRWMSAKLFELAIVVPTIGGLTLLVLVSERASFSAGGGLPGALFWVIVIALVELLPVPGWKSLQVSMAFPLATAVAFVFPPVMAGVVLFLGSSDPREIKREVTLLRALFNRSQVSLATFAASLTFHGLGGDIQNWQNSLLSAPPAVLVDFVINTTLVGIAASLIYDVPIRHVLRNLRIGSPVEFLVSYIGLGLVGLMLARLYAELGWWAIAAFVLPLLLARQMFFRTRALEDATVELRDREVLLRALSNRMAEERQDERMQIAGYLHDDLAQILYRMSLQIDIAERKLERGDGDAEKELEALRNTKDRALTVIRALIKDLHRSPLGRAGLQEALRSYCQDVEKDTGMRVQGRLGHVDMPPPIQLLCYHIAREAVMNAVKHAEASTIRVNLEAIPDGARLTVSDDGKGFDPDQGSPEGHFGLTMMRERAQVAGGSFEMNSRPGQGTIVTAEFPTSWFVQEDRSTDGDGEGTPTQGEASAQDARA